MFDENILMAQIYQYYLASSNIKIIFSPIKAIFITIVSIDLLIRVGYFTIRDPGYAVD